MTEHDDDDRQLRRAEIGTDLSDQLLALIRDGLGKFGLGNAGNQEISVELAEGPATELIRWLSAASVAAAERDHLLVLVSFRDRATGTLLGPNVVEVERLEP